MRISTNSSAAGCSTERSSLGQYRSVIVAGEFVFDADGLIGIEESYDGISWYPASPLFRRRGRYFFPSNAPYARSYARGVLYGSPVIMMGSIGDL